MKYTKTIFVFLFLLINVIQSSEIDFEESNIKELTSKTLDQFTRNPKPTVVLYYRSGSKDNFKFLKLFSKVAENHDSGTVEFGVVDLDKEFSIKNTHKIDESPLVIYYTKGSLVSEFLAPKTKSNLEKFILKPLSPISPTRGPGSWREIESTVYHLGSRNYTSFLSNNANALVMFYSPNCGHCEKMKPAYAQAADIVSKSESGVFAALDCTNNKEICDKIDIKGFPTLYFFKDGKRDESTYRGDRSKQNLLDYFNQKSKPSIHIAKNKSNNK
ncbi:hypothetical protein CYY_004595 [Polysphondylium violaceum]|uniref:Thioredoxin domain-containing protein n=1 Tax=Polysphondylium violaceum TaxID=133409 RepID=A0A8J4PV30_9MYCE|nr:hypothetical protein CYY_004595 [Polysphondylium violaceum]